MLTLEAEKRSIFGKKLEAARKTGKMPIVLYGATTKSNSYFVDTKQFKKIWEKAGESTLVSLKTPDGTQETLINDSVFHPVTGEPIHADFYALDITKPIRVKVPLVFEGVSEAVKSLGGVLVKVLHELEIEVLPRELPHNLSVDISQLATLDSHLTVREIKLPPSAHPVAKLDDIVVSVAAPKEEVEEIVEPVDLSKIEVEKKGKEEKPEEAGEGKA